MHDLFNAVGCKPSISIVLKAVVEVRDQNVARQWRVLHVFLQISDLLFFNLGLVSLLDCNKWCVDVVYIHPETLHHVDEKYGLGLIKVQLS